jgi:hypothetical protein
VWELLRALASDPEPTTDYEREFGGDNMDPPTLAINTVRGVAMHAIIQYGLWVVRNTARDGDESSISLADMPELQQLLEAHLDRSNDPSLAVRSVYGQYFPWLALIDEEWSLQQLDAIFPEDDDSKPYWDAAWWTYVAFCQPYDRMVVVLRGKYLASLRRLDETPQEVAFAVPGHKLVEHIIVYYLRGLIELDDELLLSLFSAGTPVEVRSYAIEFGGRVLQTSTDEQAERWMPRLVALWLSRREAVSSSADPLELIPFGWWFASSQLDDRWALDELRYVLEAAGWVEPDRQVVAQLAQLDLPELDLVECLTVMATNPKDEWSVLSWRDPAQDVIRRGLSSPDASARSAATALANRLAARGYSGFLELL